MTLLVPGISLTRRGVPTHWRGPMPDPGTRRLLNTDGNFQQVPEALLQDASDLGVVLWALIGLSFGSRADAASYREFSRCLNLDHLSETAAHKRVSTAIKPMLGTWITRKRKADNGYVYRATTPATARTDPYAILRPTDLNLLGRQAPDGTDYLGVADLADFCRWQLECSQRGWTVEPLRKIAERWGVTHPTLGASRDRLAKFELLRVEPRQGGRYSNLIWIGELYPTGSEADERRRQERDDDTQDARTGPHTGKQTPARRTHVARTEKAPAADEDLLTGSWDALRQSRADRRHRALVDLTAVSRTVHQRRSLLPRTHEVYLLHFPQEACFKVGITHSTSQRVDFFTSHGGIVVDRVTVENRALAELIEADVLVLVEDWHQLGHPKRPGGGYTEMWSHTGPTVDLNEVTLQARRQLAHFRAVLGQCTGSEGQK
jgi:hypothetical protein